MADIELLIKIPKEQYSLIMQSHRSGIERFISKEGMMYAIQNGTPLSPNATNGEVMKMIFGAEEIIINSFTDQIVVRMSDKYDRRFDLGWWNAPYKADKE